MTIRRLLLAVLAVIALAVPLAARAPAATAAPARHYWHLAPSANGGKTPFPRGDAWCAARVNLFHERIPANRAANHTPGPANPRRITWGPWSTQQGDLWDAYLSKVTGHMTGTTTEILEWAACKWGLDEDWLKAQAVIESSWVQSEIGDGNESFSILQVKAEQGSNPAVNDAWGGYPWTHRSTAVGADFLAAYLRARFDGAGGQGFYNGQSAGQVAKQHGWHYVMLGDIGSWYSGGFDPNGDYVHSFAQALADKTWRSYG